MEQRGAQSAACHAGVPSHALSFFGVTQAPDAPTPRPSFASQCQCEIRCFQKAHVHVSQRGVCVWSTVLRAGQDDCCLQSFAAFVQWPSATGPGSALF